MNLGFLLPHLFLVLGFLLALILLSYLLRERRSPASALAWLLAIVLLPYVGVPLYLMLGGRKLRHRIKAKGLLPEPTATVFSQQAYPDLLLASWIHGVFTASGENRVELLLDGEQAFRETLRLINEAQESIFISTFILGRDATGRSLIQALERKAREGIAVRVILDALGSAPITRGFLASLRAGGAQVAFFMPMLHLPFRGRANLRNHRKILMVDGQRATLGGMNLAQEYMGEQAHADRWRDLSLLVEGPVVAQLYAVMHSDWAFAADTPLPPPVAPAAPVAGGATLQVIASGPDVKGDPIREAILTAVCRARKRVCIVTPYFVPDEVLSESLCMAARRGIHVRLIVPRRSNHRLADLAREAYLTQLQEAGVEVLYCRGAMLHAKLMLVDEACAITGSANMDIRSLLLNYEIALCVYTPATVAQINTWIEALLADCELRKRKGNAPLELLEGVGRLFAPML